MTNPTTLFDFFVDKKFVDNSKKFSCIQTAILRYYLTASTGKRLKGDKLLQEQIPKQIKKLKKIEVNSSFDVQFHLELIRKGGEMYGKTKRQMGHHVSYGKRFFNFVAESLAPIQLEVKKRDKNDVLSYTEAIMDKSEFCAAPKINSRKTIIQNQPELYLPELKNKYPLSGNLELYKISKLALDKIFKVISNYKKYRRKGNQKCREVSANRDAKNVLRFIGWYKQQYQLSIDEVEIEKIFPVISPYKYFTEYDLSCLSNKNFADMARKEWILKQNIKEKSRDFRRVLDEYLFDFLAKASVKTKNQYLQSLINFTYLLYKDITDVEENDNFQDISLVRSMKACKRDLNKGKQEKMDKVIPFIWSEIETVCERLREEANQDYEYSSREKNNKGPKLTKRLKALHLQDFLAIAFFCIMPPDRQRTFRELTFGETLKYGIRDVERNTFTDYKKLKSEEEAKYYIHLLPHQYKTGDTYGTYWHEIKNVNYKDGKCFYDYLNQWLFEGYRDELATAEETNAVFIRTRKGVAYGKGESEKEDGYFGKFIVNIFKRKTKFPLNSHALRTVFVTHINNLGLSEEERKAFAHMMHHDLKTANQTYNNQTSDEKMALALKLLDSLDTVI